MNMFKTQRSIAIITAVLVIGGIVAGIQMNQTKSAEAQTCGAGGALGNLHGYATTDQIGRIYMSTASWNEEEAEQSSVDFAVSYDRQTNTWSGRGWNAKVGWVDFGEMNASNTTSRTAEFVGPRDDAAGVWGNWDPTIDLSNVSYNTDPGGFTGLGFNGNYTVEPREDELDAVVGAGRIDFSNVQLIDLPCDEYVDLTLNGYSNILYQQHCPIARPTIHWTTTNIVPGSCKTDAGLWVGGSGVSKPDNNISGESASGPITESNTPQVFRLKCERASSPGTYVTGAAYASCGESDDCPGGDCIIDPTTGIVIPEFREV